MKNEIELTTSTEKMIELSIKRRMQSTAAAKMADRYAKLGMLSDVEVMALNTRDYQGGIAEKMEINGVEVRDIYGFALDYHFNSGKNILDAHLDSPDFPNFKDLTLFWSFGDLVRLINNRKMNQEQYKCLENAAEMYKAYNGETPRIAI